MPIAIGICLATVVRFSKSCSTRRVRGDHGTIIQSVQYQRAKFRGGLPVDEQRDRMGGVRLEPQYVGRVEDYRLTHPIDGYCVVGGAPYLKKLAERVLSIRVWRL